MKMTVIGAAALSFFVIQGAQAASLEGSVEATLVEWAKAEDAQVSHGGITVDGDKVTIKDLKMTNGKTGFAHSVAEITANGVKQIEGSDHVSAEDIHATGITVIRPSDDTDGKEGQAAGPDGPMDHMAIESFDMKGGNILDLLPKASEDGQTKDFISRILATKVRVDSLTMTKLKFGRARTKGQEPYNSGFESLEIKGVRDVSVDSVVVRNLDFQATEKNPSVNIDSITWTATDRIENGPATKFNLAISTIHIVAKEEKKAEITMVLGKDNLTMDISLAAAWDVKGKTLKIGPLRLDSADQARIDLELLVTGFPTPEEVEAARNPETNQIKLNPLLAKMGADNLTIRVEERGLAGRLLQMGAMMSGAGDKDKLIAMIEQQGKAQIGALLGQETADQVIAGVTGFLKQGGTLDLEVKGKNGPLAGAQLMGLAMQPQSAGKLLDVKAMHQK